MYNFIKSHSVKTDHSESKRIDTHLKKEADIILKQKENLAKLTVEKELENVSNEEVAENVLIDAKKEAELIISNALSQAEEIKSQSHLEASKAGYEEGIAKAHEEYQVKIKQLKLKEDIMKKEHQQLKEAIEPYFVDLMIKMLEKITGIIAEDYRDVILYIMKSTIYEMEKAEKYIVNLSPYDYHDINIMEKIQLELLDDNIVVDLRENKELSKGQCIIETDQQIVDCSLNVQLNNLMTSMKMLINT